MFFFFLLGTSLNFQTLFYYRSQNWQELKTVLHLVNIRAAYSQFSDSVVLGTHAKTIIIENPQTNEARQLSMYALTVVANDTDMLFDTNHLSNIANIKTVMTAKQIMERANGSSTDTEFTAVFHGLITTFDLDGSSKFYTRKW